MLADENTENEFYDKRQAPFIAPFIANDVRVCTDLADFDKIYEERF